MQTREWHNDQIDKAAWGDGPWLAEYDKKQWTDEATGLPCLIVRNHMGVLCGYVGVSKEHPDFGKGYYDVDVDCVHGGLTYADRCRPHEPDQEATAICHIVDSGEDDEIWWFGFDCGHGSDVLPGMIFSHPEFGKLAELMSASYRTTDYVEENCARLAEQLAATHKLTIEDQKG